MSRRIASRLPALLLALLFSPLASGGFVAGAASATTNQAGAASRGLAPSAVEALLDLPWAARSDFPAEASYLAPTSAAATGTVEVHLTLTPSNLGLFAPAAPGAAPLSLSTIAARYGLAPASYASLEAYFEARGLTVLHTDPTRLSLSVEGSAASVGAAFGTSLRSATWDGATVRFPSSVPSLPASVASEISAISGLSAGFDRFTLPLEGAEPLPGATPDPARSTDQITPSAVHLVYGLNDLYNFSGGTHWATGKAIVLLLWGEGFDPSDLNEFFSTMYPGDFPSVNIQYYPVDQSGSTPGPGALQDPSQAPRELTLDLEWAGSAAPGATLDAVYAPDGPSSNNYSPTDSSMEDALTTAVELPDVVALSMSFGTPDGSDPSFQVAFETSFAEATQRGITLLAASGDNGDLESGGSCPAGGPPPQYPAASPQVLAVGGTAPTLSESILGTVTGLASETAWNDSGGGYSPSYSEPGWQAVGSAGTVLGPIGHRGIPDVAGPAQFDLFYYAGHLMAGNGTSFATPFWAGMVTEMDALLPQPMGFLDQRIYALAAAEANGTKAAGLIDVTGESGPSCFTPSAGWDDTTGWGSPRAGLLFEDLEASYVRLALNVSTTDVSPGGSLTVSVWVRNSSSLRPLVDLAVTLTLQGESGYFGPCGGTLSSLTVTTGAAGGAAASVGVPACYLGSWAHLTALVQSDGYYGNNTTQLRINLLGLAGFLSVAGTYPYNFVVFALIMTGATGLGLLLGRRRRRGRQRSAPPPPGSVATSAPASPPPGPDASPPGSAGPVGAPPDPGAPPPEPPSPLATEVPAAPEAPAYEAPPTPPDPASGEP